MGQGALVKLTELGKRQGALSWPLWDAAADGLATVSSGNLEEEERQMVEVSLPRPPPWPAPPLQGGADQREGAEPCNVTVPQQTLPRPSAPPPRHL